MRGFSRGSGPLSHAVGVGRTCYYWAQSDGNVRMILSVPRDVKDVHAPRHIRVVCSPEIWRRVGVCRRIFFKEQTKDCFLRLIILIKWEQEVDS